MSEGGLLAWKIQKIKKPANGIQSTCNYSDLNYPLPNPPKDKMWIKEGREWKLVPVVEAVPADASDSEVDMVAASAEKVNNTPNTSEGVAQTVATAVPVMVCRDTTPDDEIIDGVMYHKVQETDTFQGLCLKYKVTPVELRRANKMMGTNLKLAPEKLVIPLNKDNAQMRDGAQKQMTKEEMIAKLVCKVRSHYKSDINAKNQGLAYSEARAYLEMNDWDLGRAVEEAIWDIQWSSERA
ncbi:hypothetical protein ACHAWO_005727 [Cyclotella atomus]|jgi:LysM repeat protein|uniref:LysM domain-containing protein n=1 Tax=Cyclotella atomus TaxID=382360 RepID=A0ABD3P3I2_9STRA